MASIWSGFPPENGRNRLKGVYIEVGASVEERVLYRDEVLNGEDEVLVSCKIHLVEILVGDFAVSPLYGFGVHYGYRVIL